MMGLERINEFKRERQMTNEDIALASGIPKSTIDKITAGTTSDPKLETVKAILNALGRGLKDLDDAGDDMSNTRGNNFPHPEHIHIEKYRQLNYEGQRRVDEYTDDLVQSGKYKKNHPAAKDDEKTNVAG